LQGILFTNIFVPDKYEAYMPLKVRKNKNLWWFSLTGCGFKKIFKLFW